MGESGEIFPDSLSFVMTRTRWRFYFYPDLNTVYRNVSMIIICLKLKINQKKSHDATAEHARLERQIAEM